MQPEESIGSRSPLHAEHQGLGAKFADFAGWQMPLQYGVGVLAEHASVREKVGVFDVSHLGTVRVTGVGAAEYLTRCFTNDLARIGDGRAQYTLACNDNGGVIDDLIVYRSSNDDLLCVPNAANTAKLAHKLAEAAPIGVSVSNTHGEHAILAVQGPRSKAVLTALGLPMPVVYLSFDAAAGSALGGEIAVCRSGYTGEHGYELILPAAQVEPVWRALLTAVEREGGLPCGLAARDTLRTEMGYPLHGHEISAQITPVEAGLSWAVGWGKPEFWGAKVLARQRETGAEWTSTGLVLPRGAIARPGMSVYTSADESPIGVVTSGTFSPTLRRPIALIRAAATSASVASLLVDIRVRKITGDVTKPPFVATTGLR
ncbi:MAG: glycine cleavage system aminomethyltransferase GcvT [Pseudonocardiaceae bacterium]